MEFKQTQLSNGLTVVAEANPAAASLAAGFFARTGSRDETPEVAGVSHFLEHMMFKGTERRSPFDINREFDEMGASYNAFTSEENTVYYAAVLPEFQVRALDLLGDMLRPSLRQEDFDAEKKVILEEIALYQDRPQHRLFETLMARHFGDHPLANSVLGTGESIAALKRDDMLAYFNRRYSPANVTVIGVGDIDWDSFLAKTEQTCGQWDQYEVGRQTPDTPGTGSAETIVDAKLVREHIALMSHAPSAQDPRRYAAALLTTVLGDVTGSRLFYALVEPAIAEDASCHFEQMDGVGGFLTFVVTDPSRASEALGIVREEYARFQQDGPTEAEMEAARNKTASAATLRGELPMGRLTAVGFDWVYRKEYRPLAEHVDKLLGVTRDDVHEIARQFDLTAATVLGLGPNESLE